MAGTLHAQATGEKGKQNHPVDKGEVFDASTFILDHVADSHEWHLWTKKDGSAVAIYLPVILYDKGTGLHFFSSKKIAHGHDYEGFVLAHEGKYEGRIVHLDAAGHPDETNIRLIFLLPRPFSE
jgi:F-type H+-transporting ATPase subunit a